MSTTVSGVVHSKQHKGVTMAYSLDLRERVVRSWQNGRAKLWIAREFGIGISTVKRYIKRYEQTGNMQIQPQRRMQPKIGEGERAALQAQVDAHSDATLAEHIALWAASHGVTVSRSRMCRALQKIDRPRKKKTSGAKASSAHQVSKRRLGRESAYHGSGWRGQREKARQARRGKIARIA